MGGGRIIVSHGEKGGVGKSIIASLLVEMSRGECHIIEGDHAAPDVARRYKDHGYQGGSIALLGADTPADAIGDLMADIEQRDVQNIVINLPASAGQVVDEYAAEMRDVCDALGRELVVTYAIGASIDSVLSVRNSLNGGLAGRAHRRIAVFNKYFGNPIRFGWDAELSAEWGGPEIDLPALSDRVTSAVREVYAPFFRIAAGDYGSLPLIDRALLRRWLEDCRPLVDAVYGT